jgi:hypothetical protein
LTLESTILRSERIDERWTMVAVTFDVAPDPVTDAVRGVVLRALERKRTSQRTALSARVTRNASGHARTRHEHVRRQVPRALPATAFIESPRAARTLAVQERGTAAGQVERAMTDVNTAPSSSQSAGLARW